MQTVAQLMGYLDVDDDPWNRKMASAEGDVKRSSGWLGGLTTVAKGVGLGLIGVAGAAGVMGIKTAAAGEQSQVAFETLLGSAGEAKDFLGDLSSFAAATPFEMPGLVSASRQLLGVGEAADDVIPTLTAWGDTAGALGLNQDQFSRAMLAVTQSMGKGKVQAEELAQITEAGIPIWPLLSKAMGKTIPELQAMASKGDLLSSDVFPLLEKQMGKDYGGAMERQSQTLQGVWSTLMDTINMGLAKVLTPLLPMITKLIPKGAAFLGKAFDGLSSGIEIVMGWFGKAGEAGTGMASTWSRVFGAVKSFLASNLADFQGWWASIAGIFSGLVTLVQAIVARIVEFWEDHGERIMSFIGQVWDTVKTIIGSALNVIRGIIDVFIGIVTGNWGKAWDGIKRIVGAVWDTIKSIISLSWETIKTVIGTALSVVWDIVVGKFGEITTWLSGLPVMFSGAVVALWDWIWERAALINLFVQEKINALGEWLKGLPAWLAEKAGDVWGWIVTAAANAAAAAWQAIKDQFTGAGGGILGGGVVGGLDLPQGTDQRGTGGQSFGDDQRGFGASDFGSRGGVSIGAVNLVNAIGRDPSQMLGQTLDYANALAT